MKTHVFLFDGTTNDKTDEYPTNIQILYSRLRARGFNTAYYFAGPGKDDDSLNWIQERMGAAFGLGCDDIRRNAVNKHRDVVKHHDRVAVLGFSRGAAIARMFCQYICNIRGSEIEFLGCFDTVAAFLPIGIWQQTRLFRNLTVHENVHNAFHAVALHEDRKAFEPNLMNKRRGIEECWFRGNHADIGGGYADSQLSDITLEEMSRRLNFYTGVPVGLSGYNTKAPELSPSGMQFPVHREEGVFLNVWRRQVRIPRVMVNDEPSLHLNPTVWRDTPSYLDGTKPDYINE